MKKLIPNLFAFCLLVMPVSIFSQTVTESLINLREVYSPLFSGKKSALSIEYLRVSKLGQENKDTSYFTMIQVNNLDLEQQSVSIGASIFSGGGLLGSGGSASGTYTINRREGGIIMKKKEFFEFYQCINDTYRFILNTEQFTNKKDAVNTLATCGVDNISIGAEYDPENLGVPFKFFFKVDEAIFTMTRTEFEDITRTVREIKLDWEMK